jgi:hypothetical protein
MPHVLQHMQQQQVPSQPHAVVQQPSSQQQQALPLQPQPQQQQQPTPQLPSVPQQQQQQQQQVVAFAPAKPRLTLQAALDLLTSGGGSAAVPAGSGDKNSSSREGRGNSSEGGVAVQFSVREGFKWLARYAADTSDMLHGDEQLKEYLKVC